MSSKQFISEFDKLSEKEKSEVFNHIREKIISDRRAYARSVLDKIRSSGKGAWGMDAQEFVRQSRTDGRI